jgi:hypothetical protein
MTTRQLDTYVAKVRSTPAGEIKLVPGDVEASAYGPVEIAGIRIGWRSRHSAPGLPRSPRRISAAKATTSSSRSGRRGWTS